MTDEEALSGKQILEILLKIMQPDRYYHSQELFDILSSGGYLSEADFEAHKGGNESKGLRRMHNALRDGGAKGLIIKNEYSANRYQYMVPK